MAGRRLCLVFANPVPKVEFPSIRKLFRKILAFDYSVAAALEAEGRENCTNLAVIFRVAVSPLPIKSEIPCFSMNLREIMCRVDRAISLST